MPAALRQVALVVHAVAEDEAIFAGQADVIGLQVRAGLAVVVLVDQHGSVHGAGAGVLAELDDGRQGVPLVEDVIDDQHFAVDEGDFRLGLPEQLAAGGLAAIAGGVQVGQFQREVQLGQQLAGEDQAAVHHAEHHRIALGQLGADGGADLLDGGLDLGLGEQAIGFGHDLADVGEIGGHGVLRKGDRWTGQKMAGKGTQMGASGQARRQIF